MTQERRSGGAEEWGGSLVERDLAAVWHPCAQMRDYRDFSPLEVVGAEGCHLHLADGSTVIDAISSWWCKSLGHRHPRLTAALKRQADAFEHVLLANTTSAVVVDCAEAILAAANEPAGLVGDPLSRVFFSGDGSTGIEVAMKMAVQFHAQTGQRQRTRFAALQNGYHGESLATMSVSDCDLYKAPFGPLCFDALRLGPPPYRSGGADPGWMDASAEWPAIQAQLDAAAQTLAAVLVEPILQGAGGMRLYSPDLLRRLRTWCTASGVLLLADEIASGMGRLGSWLACHQAGILPDIAVLSKGLTGGYLPLTATVSTRRISDAFDGDWASGRAFLHSNTYSGHALGCAVAREVFAVYREERILSQVQAIGPRLRAGMAALAQRHPWFRNPRGVGMMAAIDLVDPAGGPFPREQRTGYRVYREAVRRGALLRNLGDTMYLFPPLIADASTIDRCLGILAESAKVVGEDRMNP